MKQLSWTTILTTLVLATSTAYLVIVKEWDYITTVFLASGTVLALVLVMTTALLLITPKEEHSYILSIIFEAMWKEWKLILSVFWRK